MLLYFITWISLLLKPLASSWACVTKITLLPLLFCQELSVKTISKMFFRNLISTRVENVEENNKENLSLLDLPELPLECILEKLPPSSLFQMASVCCSLRERCVSDHLWKKHMKQKWGGVIGAAAYREWKWHIASKRDFKGVKDGSQRGFMRFFSLFWPFQWMKLKVDVNDGKKQRSSSLSVDSVMNWYLALETGSFWFPAQVYNRENGHVGFMLSCYDAELSYDSRADSFQARYPPHGRRLDCRECGISWKRLRAPPVDTPPHDLHISDCLNELHPGDHIEIQWRRNKEFPYGWWYGVVGHLESCDGNENYCRCHSSDTVVLEFNHYTRGSRWRKTTVSRKDHREEGNEAEGFYGGIRKIKCADEISIWKSLWPSEGLE